MVFKQYCIVCKPKEMAFLVFERNHLKSLLIYVIIIVIRFFTSIIISLMKFIRTDGLHVNH